MSEDKQFTTLKDLLNILNTMSQEEVEQMIKQHQGKKEYKRKWTQDNREHINTYQCQRYQENVEANRAYARNRYMEKSKITFHCEVCNKDIKLTGKPYHMKSKGHLNMLK